MQPNQRRIAAPVLACVVAAACAFGVPATRAQVHRIAQVAGIGAKGPVRQNERMRSMRYANVDGSAIDFAADRKGTFVYNVFTTWCPSCRQELPAFSHLARELQRRGVTVVGIDQAETAGVVTAFTRDAHLPYRVVIDRDRTSNAVLGANLIPTTVVVRDGIVRTVWSGPLEPAALKQLVMQAL